MWSLRKLSDLNTSLALFQAKEELEKFSAFITKNKRKESFIIIKVADSDYDREDTFVCFVDEINAEYLGNAEDFMKIDE